MKKNLFKITEQEKKQILEKHSSLKESSKYDVDINLLFEQNNKAAAPAAAPAKPASNSAQLPPELKDVKDFQDWLDDTVPNWAEGYKGGKIRGGVANPGFKSGGYGKFGPRTKKAWDLHKDKYLKKTETPTPTVDKPDDIEQFDADDSNELTS